MSEGQKPSALAQAEMSVIAAEEQHRQERENLQLAQVEENRARTAVGNAKDHLRKEMDKALEAHE